MNTIELLQHLRNLDVHLTVQDGKLGCNAPKGVLTPDLTAELKARKIELIEFLSRTAESVFSRPVPVTRQSEFTPSPGQQRLWFLDQLDAGNAAYNIAGGLRFQGALDPWVLERALREIVSRHEALRTSIVNVDGSARAVVRAVADWALEHCSLRERPEGERLEAVRALAAEHAAERFDLRSAPLIRGKLIELDTEDHVLLISIHHVAADGWSLSVLGDELVQLYRAFLEGRPSPLEELPFQYGDYAQWQRQNLEGGVMQSEVPYWKKKLSGTLPVIELPGDRAAAAAKASLGASIRQTLPAGLADDIRRLSLTANVTPFTTLLAAFKLLLSRYTRQTDIIVGSATAGRNRPEFEKLIGLFISNLVLRTDLSGDPPARELLARVQETLLGASAHENVPLDFLAETLQPNRDLARPPLFQVMFVMQNTPHAKLELPGLTIRSFEVGTGAARFDLAVDVIEKDSTFDLRWEYNAGLFQASTMERMQGHFQRLLEGITAHPGLPISQMKMLAEQEERQFEQMAAGPRMEEPGVCLHELFEQQAAKTPGSIAVQCGDEQITYSALDARANRLAGRLRALGVKRDSLVALCLEPCIGMVVALLSVLKAGGAYVPLDPDYPQSRVAFMLEDSQAPVLITQEHLLPDVSMAGLQVIRLGRDEEAPLPASSPGWTKADADSLAYVIYTSGSTGNPKGVEITHRSLVNLLLSMQREPGMSADDRLLAITTLSFDIAGLEIYLPLISGARLVLAPRIVRADGAALGGLLSGCGATVMQATPATWRLLLESGWKGTPGLKILCGGEALPRELAARLIDTGSEVWNLYGPTETTIWSTIHRVAPGAGTVPIGKPIANTQAYVLDAAGQLAPQNVPGELFIGGAGVARGYLRRPELTREKFVENPFRAGQRLYRTGDLVRWHPDGGLEYMARLDHQVKLRGFRIELGEIEAALREQPGVREAAVSVREDTPGDQRLVAYLVMRERGAVDTAPLREALLGRLPDYMVPGRFVFLDALPLTPNRKLDRSALPAPSNETDAPAHYVAPRTESEREVAAIWADLLKREKIGVHDNFFDLGGHSLLAVQLQSRLARKFQREISIVDLFQRPTVSAIAAFLNSQGETAAQA